MSSMGSARSTENSKLDSGLPASDIPVFTKLVDLRKWRQQARRDEKSVGFIPTMGALHDGHLSLVKRSLKSNDLTVVSIFVNPAQFAPHEDLATYPRTLAGDLAALSSLAHPLEKGELRRPSAVFLPSVQDMYPSGISQDVNVQKGTFVEVKGYGHQMEGQSRPTFFRGVATVVTKLFNAVEPTSAYFGQKDIQQALLLRRMTGDLLLSHPLPENLHIVPTTRDIRTGLALSSRNAYLSSIEHEFAPVLYTALRHGELTWDAGNSSKVCIDAAQALLAERTKEAEAAGVQMRLDYIALNDAETFDVLSPSDTNTVVRTPVIMSGALWVGKTRLIDNVLINEGGRILIHD